MAGSISVTSADLGGGVTKYTIAWTSDASGNVSGTSLPVRRGHLGQVKFIPGSGGTQPTTGYNATLLDADSVDMLAGTGTSLSNTAAKYDAPLVGSNHPILFEGGDLTPTISGAGDAKTGSVILYVGV